MLHIMEKIRSHIASRAVKDVLQSYRPCDPTAILYNERGIPQVGAHWKTRDWTAAVITACYPVTEYFKFRGQEDG